MTSFFTQESDFEPNSHFILRRKQSRIKGGLNYDWVGHTQFNGELSPQEQRDMMKIIIDALNNKED